MTLQYRVNVSWWWGILYNVHQDVVVSFKADTWMVLSVHDSVDLGTIDWSLYDIDHGFSSLESQNNGVFVISNSPSGWDMQLGVSAITTPPRYNGDLLANMSWQIDSSGFRVCTNLDSAPVVIAMRQTAGSATHTIDYRYTPTTADVAGDYAVQFMYTVVAH